MEDVLIETIMTKEVESAPPGCSLREVTETMRDRRISCVIVCEEGRPVGLVTERDLVRVLADDLEGKPERPRTVGEAMSLPAFSVRSGDSVHSAIQVLEKRGFRRAPVLDDEGHLVGIVTQTDLMRAYGRQSETELQILEQRVAERTRELREANDRLTSLSLQDGLLGIGNRRAMELALDRLHETALRYWRPYSVVLVDVDHFKLYNDTYGHLQGDDLLRQIADLLRANIRSADSLYRYGGEEFLALLPETGVDGACQVAGRLRSYVEEAALPHQASPFGVATVSCGVGVADSSSGVPANWEGVIENADQALYRAKSEGRNRVCTGGTVTAVG